MKSSKGFATLLLLSLLPVVLAGGLLVFTSFAFLRNDLGTLNLCRAQQLQVQSKVAKKLDSLIKLNPKALKLRLAEAQAEKALIAAVETGNPIAIAAAESYLLKIQLQRQALGLKQRSLILTANTELKVGGAELQRRLVFDGQGASRPLSSWLQSNLRLTNAKVPNLAVQADLPDAAPLYEPLPNFEEAQAWSQNWQLEIKTVSWAQRFFNFHGRFQRSCSSSLYSENTGWIAKMKKAKSLLKGFS